MPKNETTIDQVIDYIANRAGETDVSRIITTLKGRQETLQAIRAAAVTEGARVRITNIRPKYLENMQGEITRIVQKRTRYVTVLLNEASTEMLRQHRPGIGWDVKRHELTGIPASCCQVLR
ncbi:hypothetical protein [Streptomyces megasporus]|uniref:hypothetical protein n=1 Tax=Streptomyces megasporus TaxID=44060 RepID=UPI0004E16EB8|nr:hypothetical protein [Streptomyces megasporus]